MENNKELTAEKIAHEKKKQNLVIAVAGVLGVAAAILLFYFIGKVF